MDDVDVSPRAARAIAESGYVFLFPLVVHYGRLYAEIVDRSSSAFIGGFGRWAHDRHARSLQTDLGAAHFTTVVSSAWLDVRAEPWVCTIPATGGERTTVFTDLWGYAVHDEAFGRSERVGPIAVASLDWIGTVADPVTRLVRAESSFVRCETSLRIADAGDLERIREIVGTYDLQPWSGSHGSPPRPPLTVSWWPFTVETLTTTAFWDAAAFALSFTTPHDDDRAILEQLTEIGVDAGARWNGYDLGPGVVDAIEDGIDHAIAELMRGSATTETPPTGLSRPASDRDYFGRALAAIRLLPPVGQPS